MNKQEIAQWIHREFSPVKLVTDQLAVNQSVENAVRYWNSHSAYKITKMFSASPGVARIQLDTEFKNVVRVYPATTPDWILQNHPMWTLLGITIIDNLTSDLVMLSEAYRNYRYYIGTDFKFLYEPSEDPEEDGGYLYMTNLPSNTTRVAVVGTKRIRDDEDIKTDHILHWIQYYAKALTKMTEGNALRKTDVIGVKNDGQALFDEGKEEKKELEEKLAMEGRWVAFVRKF